MKCNKCGKEIADDSKFCPFCGSEVTATVDATVVDDKKEGTSEGKFNILGVVGFCLSMLGILSTGFPFCIAGWIVSSMGVKRSTELDASTKLGKAGRVVGIIGTIFWIVCWIIFAIVMTVLIVNGVINGGNTPQ